jgi:hypothetical protein
VHLVMMLASLVGVPVFGAVVDLSCEGLIWWGKDPVGAVGAANSPIPILSVASASKQEVGDKNKGPGWCGGCYQQSLFPIPQTGG